jgi:hypothetical protein
MNISATGHVSLQAQKYHGDARWNKYPESIRQRLKVPIENRSPKPSFISCPASLCSYSYHGLRVEDPDMAAKNMHASTDAIARPPGKPAHKKLHYILRACQILPPCHNVARQNKKGYAEEHKIISRPLNNC